MYKSDQVIIRILFFLQSLLWIVLFLPVSLFYKDILSNYIIVSGILLASVFLTGISVLLILVRKQILEITIVDIFVLCYFGYILLNAYYVRPIPVPDILLLKYFLIILIYISARSMSDEQKEVGLIIIVIIGVIEAIIIIFQWVGLLESEHMLFNFTGSFSNPGLVGGFIACSLCVLIYFYTITDRSAIKLLLIVCGILLLCSLMLTNSRAGWVAAIFGICYLAMNSENKIVIRIKSLIKKRLTLKTILISISLVIVLFVYHYKRPSADGRLFIWEVSMEMVKDKPLLGHGIGMFRSNYPYYQAGYFEQNPNSGYIMVAGDAFTPFNEYISVLVTHGIIGFIFLVLILLSLFLYKSFSSKQKKQKAILLTICFFAFFSYPTEYYRLLILFSFIVAILPSKSIVTIKWKCMFIPIFLIAVYGLYWGIKTIKEYKSLAFQYKMQRPIPWDQYGKIQYDIILLQNYYEYTIDKIDDADRLKIIKDYVILSPSTNSLCELGRIYKTNEDFNRAWNCFTFAKNINPSLITPNYELFLLYQKENDTINMGNIGETILHQKVKKEGTISIKIKTYVKEVLDELDN